MKQETLRLSLIVDPDRNFLTTVLFDPKASLLRPHTAFVGKDAQNALADNRLRFVSVIINPKVDQPKGLSVIRCSRMYRPSTPIYVIYDGEAPFDETELKLLGIQEMLKKPITYTDIVDRIAPHLCTFDPNVVPLDPKQNTDSIGIELAIEDKNLVAIRAEDFLTGTKSYFNIYVRRSSDRYAKIVQSGGSMDLKSLASTLSEGVTHLYLEKEEQSRYVAFCDQLAKSAIRGATQTQEVKLSRTLVHGEETLNYLRSQGFSTATLDVAKNFTANVELFTRQVVTREHVDISAFLGKLENYNHAVSTTLMASLLAKALNFEGTYAVQILGLAAFLHDVGLETLNLTDEDEADLEKMAPDKLKLYYTHPTVGASLCEKISGISPAVVQATAQHHERKDRKGFPARLRGGSINHIAEIVGVSDEFVRLIVKSKGKAEADIIQAMQSRVLKGFSNEVVEAFHRAFISL